MILEPVKIAVIGSGGYAFQLIKRILSVPHCGTVVAVTSRDLECHGARYCRERKIPVFQTVEELLDFGEFEVVVNPTPIHLHTSITKQCLEAGFPVWLEKPPVATVQELDELQSFSEDAGLPVAVCFNSLFSHLTQNLKKELVDGRFGDVRQVKGIGAWIRNSDYFNRNSWAGSLKIGEQWILDGDVNNPFAHVLCNNLYFAATEQHALAEPVKVEAELYRCNEIQSEDTSCLRIKTRNGVEIIDYLTLGPQREIPPKTLIETEKALISFENFNRLKIEFYDGSVEEHEAYQEDRIEMIEHLCRAFRTGEPYLCSLNMMRPFTLAVNGSFDSAGNIHTIPAEFLHSEKRKNTTSVNIAGIETTMHEAFASNSLFSEIGVPWARKSHVIDTSDYSRFPERFEVHMTMAASK
jgi:predicted dehydrogenase